MKSHTLTSNADSKIKRLSWQQPSLSSTQYLLGAASVLSVWINSPYWYHTMRMLGMHQVMDWVFLVSQMLMVLGLTCMLLFLLCWGKVSKPLLSILMMLSCLCAYFSFEYQIYIDRGMLANVMRTDVHEVRDLFNVKLLLWLVVFLLPALVYVWGIKINRRVNTWYKTMLKQLLWAVVALVLALGVSLPIYKQYASFFRNHRQVVKMLTPFNFLSASFSYAKHRYHDANQHFVHVGLDAKQVKPVGMIKPTVFVVVVGETGRGDRLSLNGYSRPTNPLLSQQAGLISFQDASSCGTATAYSVPCMFSDLSRREINIDDAPMRDNLLDIAQRAGVKVDWVDNNSGCQETCNRVPHQQLKQDCPEGLCDDEQLIEALHERLKRPVSEDELLVLHMNGSHGPAYYQRYPKQYEVFKPSCNSTDINTCSQQQLDNVYDNTVVHTDAVLSQMIDALKTQTDKNMVLLYVSDHGESLGEKGLYLHGTPYAIAPKEQTQIQMLWWANADFYAERGIDETCLQNLARTQAVSQDNVFHTILSGLNIHTQAYQASLDWLHPCAATNTASKTR